MSDTWSPQVYDVLREQRINTIATVPDGGLTNLLRLCEDDPDQTVVTLSTEEEGVGLLFGLWLGGERGALMMQSSGTGNCINALSLPASTQTPCLMLVTMRGQWGEFNPWQVSMGQAVQPVFETMGVKCYPVMNPDDIAPAFDAAANLVFSGGFSAAVLIHQSILGSKRFGK